MATLLLNHVGIKRSGLQVGRCKVSLIGIFGRTPRRNWDELGVFSYPADYLHTRLLDTTPAGSSSPIVPALQSGS